MEISPNKEQRMLFTPYKIRVTTMNRIISKMKNRLFTPYKIRVTTIKE